MKIPVIATDTGVENLAAGADVLTATPSATNNTLCQVVVDLGTTEKPLDGTGEQLYEMTITIDGVVSDFDPMYSLAADGRTKHQMQSYMTIVPAAGEVIVHVKSPNAADIEVGVTVTIYDVSAVDLGAVGGSADAAASLAVAAARLANKSTYTVDEETGVGTEVVRNAADTADLYTITYTEAAGVQTRSSAT